MCLSDRRRLWLLLAVAVVFHIVGIAGIGLLRNAGILSATPLHLLLMSGLLVASFHDFLHRFLPWGMVIFIICFAAEWVGVHYGWLFGGYSYGATLGIKWQGIPLIIGMNWILVAASAISLTQMLSLKPRQTILLAATAATAYDWLLEPLAVRLQYWNWNDGRVPSYNYICWWALSAVSAMLWIRFRLQGNLFAAGLFILQIVFFVLLRILL